MNVFRAGSTALLAIALTLACAKDSGGSRVVAPATDANAIAVRHSENDDDMRENRRIAIRDDCDPRDPAWGATGGCMLRRGDVTFLEFMREQNSTLSLSVVGHQAWRNDPSYVKILSGSSVTVRNEGGRPHTFTEVATFGGGKVPPLNRGLVPAPECPGSMNIPPGGGFDVSGLAPGNHRFQCCIHPWMRAIIKVQPTSPGERDES